MPNTRSFRKGSGEEKGTMKKGKSAYRASSFHGQDSGTVGDMMRRPRTVPNLFASSELNETREQPRPLKLQKLLLNVTIQRSIGPVHVIMSPDSTVGDLIAAAVRVYVKDGRRPVLKSSDPEGFDLHYSQFSLESLDKEEKLMTLGSRNFFLCPREAGVAESNGSCSKEASKATIGCLCSNSWICCCENCNSCLE